MTTKYNIGDRVFAIVDNEIKNLMIDEIRINIMGLSRYILSNGPALLHRYSNTDTELKTWEVYESKVFNTKEELIESLK